MSRPARSGIFDADRLVAYAEVGDDGRGDAAVHPQYRGRGIGTALAAWTRELARAARRVGLRDARAARGLRRTCCWSHWATSSGGTRGCWNCPRASRSSPSRCRRGTRSGPHEGEADHRAAWTVIEDAFLEWSQRDRQSFEDFCATTMRRPGFEPWNLRIVVDPDGNAVGACFLTLNDDTGYVSQLAVRRDRRGLGLARALLADAFSNAREHGATRCDLCHRLAHRCPRPLRAGRNGGHRHLGPPRRRPQPGPPRT